MTDEEQQKRERLEHALEDAAKRVRKASAAADVANAELKAATEALVALALGETEPPRTYRENLEAAMKAMTPR